MRKPVVRKSVDYASSAMVSLNNRVLRVLNPLLEPSLDYAKDLALVRARARWGRARLRV
jgi:hypothetical protein